MPPLSVSCPGSMLKIGLGMGTATDTGGPVGTDAREGLSSPLGMGTPTVTGGPVGAGA